MCAKSRTCRSLAAEFLGQRITSNRSFRRLRSGSICRCRSSTGESSVKPGECRALWLAPARTASVLPGSFWPGRTLADRRSDPYQPCAIDHTPKQWTPATAALWKPWPPPSLPNSNCGSHYQHSIRGQTARTASRATRPESALLPSSRSAPVPAVGCSRTYTIVSFPFLKIRYLTEKSAYRSRVYSPLKRVTGLFSTVACRR